jgi:hypothetical protein
VLSSRLGSCRAPLSSEPIQVGIPCPALAGKERDRLIWWHHLDGNGALGAVMELGRGRPAPPRHSRTGSRSRGAAREADGDQQPRSGSAARERGVAQQPTPASSASVRVPALSGSSRLAPGHRLLVPAAMLEPDHHAGGADEGDHEHAGDTVRINLAGEQLKAQVDLPPGGLGGSEQDWIVDLVPP